MTAFLWWLATLQSGLFALGWIAPIPLLWSLHGLTARARFLSGWRCGFCCFALLNWWIAVAIMRGAPMIGVSPFGGFLLGIFSVALIGAIHGSALALVAWFWDTRRISSTRFSLWMRPVGIAALWTLLDILRCSGPLAHSWGALAFTQWRDVALLQSASLVGQHGLTFLCVWCAASLALWLRASSQKRSEALWRAPLGVFLLLHVWGAWRLRQADASPSKSQLRILLVQTTVSGFDGQNAFAQAYNLTFRATRQRKFDIVVWPETTFFASRHFGALSISTDSTPGAIWYGVGSDLMDLQTRQLDELSRTLQTPILCGASVPVEDGSHFFERDKPRSNQALLFDGSGQVQARAKTHLVPFGERAPWGEFMPWLRALAPSPEVETGVESEPLAIWDAGKGRVRIGTLICFESCFEQPSRALRKKGAQVLFVLTNDEWCAGTEAPWQHAAMSAIRAVENGVPVAQAANGGVTFVVDRWGRFVVKNRFNAPRTAFVTLRLN